MDASSNGHPEHIPEDVDYFDEPRPTGWRWWLPRSLGVGAFIILVLFWIWAFANQDSIAHPDEFDDPTYTVAAESLCAKRQAIIAEIPLATAVDNPQDRGLLVEDGTVQLVAMLDELAELTPPTDPKGATTVTQWLTDYQLYISDRVRYADILATGSDPAFRISGTEDGVRVTDLLTTFADVNNMASCGPSGDV